MTCESQTRKRPGPKPSGKARTVPVMIRLRPDERQRLEDRARADHLPISTWIRQLALRELEE